MKRRKWSVNVNGQEHIIEFTGCWKYRYCLLVDGTRHTAYSMNTFHQLVDYQINFGDVVCHFVVIGFNMDLAVDGKYVGTGKDYEPISPIPTPVTVMAAVSLVFALPLNGILGFFIGWFLGVWYRNLYMEKKSIRPVLIAFAAASAAQISLRLLLFLLTACVK